MTNEEFLGSGSVELTTSTDVEKFMCPAAMGLNKTSESWFVASHGRW